MAFNGCWINKQAQTLLCINGVEDTPLQKSAYIGCPAHSQNSCGSMDMFTNFMDYVDDDCMVMFTQGQMERMIATIEFFGETPVWEIKCSPDFIALRINTVYKVVR